MDQVKEALAVALKYGFWIGSSIVLLGALTVWYLSTTSLDQEIDRQMGIIKSDVQKVSQYRGEMSDQPNEISHQLMNGMIEERKDEVMLAWQAVFDAQRDILNWPTIMQEEFLNEFQFVRDPETGEVDKTKLKLPFEKYEEFGNEEHKNVAPTLLRRYEQYIGLQLPNLAAIAKAKWTADFKKKSNAGMGMDDVGYDDMGMGSMGMMRRTKVDITGATDEPVVKWSTSSQESVLKDLFPWRGAKDYPSELDVYYSQENLWIVQQLLKIVAEVNGDASQSFEAKIREIKRLSIGKSVTFNQGNISDPGSRASFGYGGDMGYGMEDDMMGMGGDVEMGYGVGGLGLEVETVDPGDGRYVNTAFEPIDAASLRGAFSSNDPNQVAIAVAKRVPVMLQLQMDQQSVPKLLAACGNAPLMVDVSQVRIMPKGGSGSTGGMGGMGMDMGMGMDDEMMMGGGMGSMGAPSAPGMAQEEEFPTDMDVEIYGLIYFWNPPNTESLGVEKIADQDDITIDASAEVIDALPGPVEPPPVATTTPPDSGQTTPPATPPAETATPTEAAPPVDSSTPAATPRANPTPQAGTGTPATTPGPTADSSAPPTGS